VNSLVSGREERILALIELHEIGILHRDEFVTEMKCVTDPQTFDPVSTELQRQGCLHHMGVLTRRALTLDHLAGRSTLADGYSH
jgi:hypothetical protein